MKVLILDLGKIIRGGQRQVYYLARHLAETPDFAPLVVTPAEAPLRSMVEKEGIPCAPIPSGSDINPYNIISFLRLIAKHKPDVIHTNDAKGASLAAFAKKLNSSFKLVHSRRVSYPLKAGWSKKKYLYGDAVVAVSKEIQDVLINCGIPEEKTSTIHSGIDASLYSMEKEPANVLTIGAIGALSAQKGFDVLIESLAHLRKAEMPDWQCMIAGDGPLYQDLKAKADELNLSEFILFLGYRESREVLPKMNILVVPSVDGEGSNAVIKEGWASATPVITSDLPSNLELATHEHDSLVFSNRNAKGLAESILRLVNRPKLAEQLVETGKESVKRFTDKAMADHYMILYRALLS